jgi:uncharacterized protein YkwD
MRDPCRCMSKQIRMILLSACCGLLLTGGAEAAALSEREASLLGAVNAVRAAHDLRPLSVDGRLVRAARGHSATLLRRDVLTHGDFHRRMRRSGARGPLYGENLAWGTGARASARKIVRAWLQSPSHRRNLLRPGFRRIGLGTKTGTFAGRRGTTMVTADFAGR